MRVSNARVFRRVGALLFIAAAVVFLRSPVGRALTKSKSPFVPVATDARVRFEPGAETMAVRAALFLDSAIAAVEAGHGRPFRKPFTVYVTATQRSLNEFAGLPPNAPIRGIVLFGDLFIAPSAFDWHGMDNHRQSMMHELSHLHLRQRLGTLAARGEVPPWFHEALADLVSGAGGESLSVEEATRAILEGPALRPDSTGNLWTLARAGNYGLPGPMLHRQGRMFIEYLQARDPEGFKALVVQLQEDRTFAKPFRDHFGGSVNDLWGAFAASLRAEGAPGDGPLEQ